jgi:hypothetical protein
MEMRRWYAVILAATWCLAAVALSSFYAMNEKRAFERALASQAEQREAQMAKAESFNAALASRDMEIARLNARIDEQWREFYETLEARQPVLK